MQEIGVFKIRASAAHELMGPMGLTVSQLATLNKLKEKVLSGKSLTANQQETHDDLLKKANNPELPKGAKSYCDNWIIERLYDRRKPVYSKYIDKGNECEDDAIEYVSGVLGWGLVFKNTERIENDWLTGECDINLPNSVEDIKNCYDCFTFPLLEDELNDKANEMQIQCYMHLYGKKKGGVVKVLMNSPESIVDKECRIVASRNDGELTEDEYEEILNYHTYDHLDDKLRVKRFEFDYDEKTILELKKRVILCRKYIKNKLKSKGYEYDSEKGVLISG